MKKTLIGGFLTLSGTIGIVILLVACILNPVTSWITPPGRLICTMLEHGSAVPIGCFLIIFITGLFILGIKKRMQLLDKVMYNILYVN